MPSSIPPVSRIAMAASCCSPRCSVNFHSSRTYQGPIFANALVKILPDLETEIVVRRSDHAKGFVPLPKRWIVERTIAWLNRCDVPRIVVRACAMTTLTE
jgi:hypothetical protein